MKNKGLLICVLMLLMLSPVLIFAGGGQEEEQAVEEEGPVEITFKHVFTGDRGDVIGEIVEEFNASQDRVVASHEHVSGWYGGLLEQLQADAVANQLPEVAIMGLSESVTMRRDLGAVSLEQYIERDDYNLDDFIPELLALGQDTMTDEQFALPYAVSTPLIYVNKDLFRDAGLDPEKEPQYWTELREWAKEVSDMDSDVSGISFQLDFDVWQFQVLLESFGGLMANAETRKIHFNDEPGQRVMDFWLGMMHEDGSFPNISGGEAADNFINGKLGIIVATTGNYSAFTREADFDLGIHVLPPYDTPDRKNPRRVAAGGSNIFMLPASEEKQEAAWEFIQFALNTESLEKIKDGMGYMVAREELIDQEIRAYEMLDDIVNWYNWPRQGSRITDIFRGNIMAAFNEDLTGQEALDKTAEEAKRILGW